MTESVTKLTPQDRRVLQQAILDLHRNGEITVAERDAMLADLPVPESLAQLTEPEETDDLSAETVLDVVRRLLGINKSDDGSTDKDGVGTVDGGDPSASTINVPITKTDAEKGQVFGFAMFAESPEHPGQYHIDKQGDFITPEDLEESVYDFVLHSRDGGAMHMTKGNSTLIESVVFTPEKLEKMGLPTDAIPAGAWWLGYQIHDEDVRKLVREGKLAAFSIEGLAEREEVA